MSSFDYYETPDDAIFQEIKDKSIEIWKTYDDTYGYASGKIERVNKIDNYKDNAWFIVTMFDLCNQQRLVDIVNEETRKVLLELIEFSKRGY